MGILSTSSRGRRGGQAGVSLGVLVSVFALLFACSHADPLMGQGMPPAQPVDVYVSFLLEKLLGIDEGTQRFEAVFTLYLSWSDDKALNNAARATKDYRDGRSDSCSRGCRSDIQQRSDYKKNLGELLCCDNVWLPSLKVDNVYGTLVDKDQNEVIFLDQDGNVGWKVQLEGEFYSPMDFSKFPFDTQELDLHFTHGAGMMNVIKNFHTSALARQWFQRAEGDAAPGWSVTNVSTTTDEIKVVDQVSYYTSTYGHISNTNDPLPLAPGKSTTSPILDETTDKQFTAIIHVKRFSGGFVMKMIMPLICLKALLFASYFIPAKDAYNVRTRMFTVIFLSITALNFAVDKSIPTTSYATGIEELLVFGYIIAAISTPQAIVVGVLEQNAVAKASQEKSKEKEVTNKLKLGEIFKTTPPTAAAAKPKESTSIPIAFGEPAQNKAPNRQQSNGALNVADAFSKALSMHFSRMAEKPKETFNFTYKSRAAMVIDRFFYYGFLICSIVAFSLFFQNGEITG